MGQRHCNPSLTLMANICRPQRELHGYIRAGHGLGAFYTLLHCAPVGSRETDRTDRAGEPGCCVLSDVYDFDICSCCSCAVRGRWPNCASLHRKQCLSIPGKPRKPTIVQCIHTSHETSRAQPPPETKNRLSAAGQLTTSAWPRCRTTGCIPRSRQWCPGGRPG